MSNICFEILHLDKNHLVLFRSVESNLIIAYKKSICGKYLLTFER